MKRRAFGGAVRITAAFLLLSFALLAFAACQSAPANAETAMQTFCLRYAALPAGRVRYLKREAFDPDGMRERLVSVLYGDGKTTPALEEQVASGAVFLGDGAEEPAECGVFACRSRNEATAVAAVCLSRLDRLRRAFPALPALLTAEVRIYGCTVVYCVLPDNRAAFRIWDGIL